MIWLFILTGYLLGWFPTALLTTREFAVYDTADWTDAGFGAFIALFWPLVLPVAVVKRAANRPTKPKPTPRVLSERELAQLEVAAGIKPRGVEGIDYNTPFDRPYTVR